MRRILGAWLILAVAGAAGLAGFRHARASSTDHIVIRTADATGRHEITLLSRTHTIDGIYESMQGPYSNQGPISLVFCHSNLTFTPQALSERRTGGTFTPVPGLRLVTLVPGRLEVSLPEGFGLPVFSDEPLDYVLNVAQPERTGWRASGTV